jgi:dienelactone hydrolase
VLTTYSCTFPYTYASLSLPLHLQTPFDTGAWFARHPPERMRSLIDKVISALKEQQQEQQDQGTTGVKTLSFGITGYCAGGKWSLVLAQENVPKVAVVTHPGMVDVPGDYEVRIACISTSESGFETRMHDRDLFVADADVGWLLQKLKASSKTPVLLVTCETDEYFPLEQQKVADEVLGGGQYTPGYMHKHFMGCTHGFAVRGDLVSTHPCPLISTRNRWLMTMM